MHFISMSNLNDDQFTGKRKSIDNTNKTLEMPLPSLKQRSAYGTYLYFVEAGVLETFKRDYRQILTAHFQKIRIEGTGEYWTCGQGHDTRNWNWKPWQHLERLCRKCGLDDFAVREILFEHLGRKLECKCQVLYAERELRRQALKRQFGVDFGSGEVGLVD
ncbi:MAG: hypothetical protein WBV91_13335 [Desulfobacterales bacterium]